MEVERKEMDSAKQKKQSRESSRKLNLEMVLRKSFCDSAKDYVTNCSLAGAKRMCDPEIGLFKRLIWTLIFCASFSTACYFLVYVWSNTLTKPLIVTMESKEYPIGSIDFPAVAVCNINRISKKALQKLAMDEYSDIAKHRESLEEVQTLLLNLGRLINYSYNESVRTHPVINRLIEKYRDNSDKIRDIMNALAPSCEDMLLRCAWGGEILDCHRIFTTRNTANRGLCCTFNYVLDYNALKSGRPLAEVKRQTTSGWLQGLNVLLDPQLDDYAYPLSNIKGFDVFIFEPMHLADPNAGRVLHRISEPDSVVYLELETTKQIASHEIKKYGLETRQCLFRDEKSKKFSNLYSYSSCIVSCRIMTIRSLCNCIPFFLAPDKRFLTAPICTLENLKCLNRYKEKLYSLYPKGWETAAGLEMELEDSLVCDCLPDCEVTQHRTKSSKVSLHNNDKKDLKEIMFNGIDMKNKSMLTVYHPKSCATLVRLDVVNYWYEVLSGVGGFTGVIVGFSFISIVEIIYFFSIRFLQNVYANYKKYH